jgi:hypothetical protein
MTWPPYSWLVAAAISGLCVGAWSAAGLVVAFIFHGGATC